MKIQFKRNNSNTSTLPASANAGEPIWFKDQLYIGSVGGSKIDGTSAPVEGALIGIARADHDHAGVYQPVGNYLTSWNAADNYAFKTIAISAASSAVTAPTANTNSQTADSNTDTLTITPSNKWIGVGGSSTAATDVLYIGHALSGVAAGTYKSVTVDAAGHVTAGTNPTTLAGYGITDGDRVKQSVTSTAAWRKLLQSYNTSDSETGTITSDTVNVVYYVNSVEVQPSTGTLKAPIVRASSNDLYVGSASASQCHQQYDATNQCLKFIFD